MTIKEEPGSSVNIRGTWKLCEGSVVNILFHFIYTSILVFQIASKIRYAGIIDMLFI